MRFYLRFLSEKIIFAPSEIKINFPYAFVFTCDYLISLLSILHFSLSFGLLAAVMPMLLKFIK